MKKIMCIVIGLCILLIGCVISADEETQEIEANGSVYLNSENGANNDALIEVQHNFSADELYLNDVVRISGLVGLKKGELLSFLGEGYRIRDVLGDDGYEYQEQGIIVVFDHLGTDCHLFMLNEHADINGIRLGMTISEVQEIFGDGELHYYAKDRYGPYILFYVFEDFSLWFAAEENGETVDFQIRFWTW